MGVINVTPDSFSDGGACLDPAAAVQQARRLVAQGAGMLDVGAESTRPGAAAVAAAEEWRRLEPVLAGLRDAKLGVPISVDTRKDEIMLRAMAGGADWINDASGQATKATLAKLASYPQMGYIAMHMPFSPDIMQKAPLGAQAALEAVGAFFAERYETAVAAGLRAEQIWLDPGIGFGKTDAANVQLMRQVGAWTRAGLVPPAARPPQGGLAGSARPPWGGRAVGGSPYQIAIGISRKSLLGRTLNLPNPKDRDPPSKTLELALAMLGARIIRTHAVQPLRRLLDLLDPQNPVDEGAHA